MPSNRPATTRTDTLPEFLRSKAVGAVVAEALDAGVDGPPAVAAMVRAAAAEIRQHHGLPVPQDVPVDNLEYRFQRGYAQNMDEPENAEATA